MTRLLAIFIGLIAGASLLFQAWQLHLFMHAGPRFTAGDGQALCERVQAVERVIGWAEKPCEYSR